MNSIIDLAVAYWRLEKWVANAPVEKKMAANSSLRTMKRSRLITKCFQKELGLLVQ